MKYERPQKCGIIDRVRSNSNLKSALLDRHLFRRTIDDEEVDAGQMSGQAVPNTKLLTLLRDPLRMQLRAIQSPGASCPRRPADENDIALPLVALRSEIVKDPDQDQPLPGRAPTEPGRTERLEQLIRKGKSPAKKQLKARILLQADGSTYLGRMPLE
jgi:hypothetical protein